jgi:large subunit ribosomal protein L9
MAYSEVLLTQQVEHLGAEGEQVRVKAGYARNYLLPRKIAVPLNKANRKQIEALRKARAVREERERSAAEKLADQLRAARPAIAVKTGEGGRMFGAVTAVHVHEKLVEAGIEIDRRQVHVAAPIKELGKHTASVKVHPEISVDVEFEIVSENAIVDTESPAEDS